MALVGIGGFFFRDARQGIRSLSEEAVVQFTPGPMGVLWQPARNMGILDRDTFSQVFAFEDKQLVYLVMELCSGGELFDDIIAQGYFGEADASTCMKQLLSALYYMHTQGVAHRNLKPANFLLKEKKVPLSKNTIKVIGFGIAGKFSHKPCDQGRDTPTLRTMAGTAYYVPPGVFTGKYSETCEVRGGRQGFRDDRAPPRLMGFV